MDTLKTLKTKNLKFIVIILIVDITILMTTLSSDKISSLLALNNWLFNLVKCGTIITITALLINYLLPPNLKATIVFWRLSNALPGCHAFSKLANHDPRIDIHALQKKLGAFPTAAREQNALWYRLFKQHESNIAIEEAHQRFLFFRDITSMTVLVLAFFPIIAYFEISSINAYKYALAFMIGQYFLFMIAARNTANRLVQNVLALESISTKFTKRSKK